MGRKLFTELQLGNKPTFGDIKDFFSEENLKTLFYQNSEHPLVRARNSSYEYGGGRELKHPAFKVKYTKEAYTERVWIHAFVTLMINLYEAVYGETMQWQ